MPEIATSDAETHDTPTPSVDTATPQLTPAHLAAARDEIHRLNAEADAHLALARRIAAIQQRRSELDMLTEALERPDPVARVASAVDEAAFIFVNQGDRFYREYGLKDAAAESYRAVVERFPQSRWAAAARERLIEIEKS